MSFVCLSHFATGYFASIGHPERQDLTDRISMLASPAFMLISGSMLGLLSAARSTEQFARLRDKLVDRGLFPSDNDSASTQTKLSLRLQRMAECSKLFTVDRYES